MNDNPIIPNKIVICPFCYEESDLITEDDFQVIAFGLSPKYGCDNCKRTSRVSVDSLRDPNMNSQW